MNLFNLLFPKFCINCKKLGSYLCPNCFSYISFNENSICLMCKKPAINSLTHPGCKAKYSIDGAISSLAYKGVVKKLMYQFKYKHYLTDLKELLGELFYEGIIQNQIFHKILIEKPILVPIPLHKDRFKIRGYNHAEILSIELSKKLNLPTLSLLKRTKKTKSQFGLTREQRKENLKNAFSFSSSSTTPESVFLVDDILTTGSTLIEAASVLKRNGIKSVFGLTLARD